MDSYIYFVLIVFFVAISSLFSKRDLVHTFLLSIVLVLFIGTRVESDADFWAYKNFYEDIPYLSNYNELVNSFSFFDFELGFYLYTSFLKEFGSVEFFFLSITFFSIFSKLYFIKNQISNFYSVAFVVYFSLVLINSEFIQIRWSLAIGILACSLISAINRRYVSSILFGVIAVSVHITSISVFFVILSYILFQRAFRKLSYLPFIFLFLSSVALSLLIDFSLILLNTFTSISGWFYINKLVGYLSSIGEPASISVLVIYLSSLLSVCIPLFYLNGSSFSKSENSRIDNSLDVLLKIYLLLMCFVIVSFGFHVFSQRLFIFCHLIGSIASIKMISSLVKFFPRLVLFSIFILASCLVLLHTITTAYTEGHITYYNSWFFS